MTLLVIYGKGNRKVIDMSYMEIQQWKDKMAWRLKQVDDARREGDWWMMNTYQRFADELLETAPVIYCAG